MEITPPSSPTSRFSNRRHSQMFKATTPHWKETMRNRCFERLKNSRAKLMNNLRQMRSNDTENNRSLQSPSVVDEVMNQECEDLLQEMREMKDFFDSSQLERYEALTALEISIRQELKEQEEKYIADYYQHLLDFQKADLEDMVEKLDKTLCPVCKRSFLQESSDIITCECGVVLFDRGEPVDLNAFLERLHNCIELHSQCCPHDPHFSCVTDDDIDQSSILVICSECNYRCFT